MKEKIDDKIINSTIRASINKAKKVSATFKNRIHAGKLLAQILKERGITDSVFCAIPNGGIPVALSLLDSIPAPFYICFASKIPFSDDRRFGAGAVDMEGKALLNPNIISKLKLDDDLIKKGIIDSEEVIKKGIEELSIFFPSIPNLSNKTVLVIDDGIATGYTALAAIAHLKKYNPKNIIVASPVGGLMGRELLRKSGYEVITVIEPIIPTFFSDYFYKNFEPVTFEYLKTILSKTNFKKIN